MRKLKNFAVLLIVLCALVSAPLTASADVDYSKFIEPKLKIIYKSVMNLGQSIAANNKPAFEIQLTKRERYFNDTEFLEIRGYSGVFWKRFWAKDKTFLAGWAKKNKKFQAYFIDTKDPEMVFAGGIRVGASTKVLEKFFGLPLSQISMEKGWVGSVELLGSDGFGPLICIDYRKGVITEIRASNEMVENDPVPIVPYSERFNRSAQRTIRKMGFQGSFSKNF